VMGVKKLEDLGPMALNRLMFLEEERTQLVKRLTDLLDPENKIGRWAPDYLTTLQRLQSVEAQIAGFCYAMDLDIMEVPKTVENLDPEKAASWWGKRSSTEDNS